MAGGEYASEASARSRSGEYASEASARSRSRSRSRSLIIT
jgi:hypothetical protein